MQRVYMGTERRDSAKFHINKELNPVQIGALGLSIFLGILAAGWWATREHTISNMAIADNTAKILVNTANIQSEREARDRDREVTMRFYTSIESEVKTIKNIMIKRDDRINDFMTEMRKSK